jgi:HJR/Mrr/RecB family endonuclease
VDVIAITDKAGVLIQCKSSSVEGKQLGWEAVKDVVAGRARYAARHPGVSFSLLAVTNRRFNGVAEEQAAINHVELVDIDVLAGMLSQNPVKRSELLNYHFEG